MGILVTPAGRCREAAGILRAHELDANGISAVELLDVTADLIDAAMYAIGNLFPISDTFAASFVELVTNDPMYGPPLALAEEICRQHEVSQRGGDL